MILNDLLQSSFVHIESNFTAASYKSIWSYNDLISFLVSLGLFWNKELTPVFNNNYLALDIEVI